MCSAKARFRQKNIILKSSHSQENESFWNYHTVILISAMVTAKARRIQTDTNRSGRCYSVMFFFINIIYLNSKTITKIKTKFLQLCHLFFFFTFFPGLTKFTLRVIWLSLQTVVWSTPKHNEQLSVIFMNFIVLTSF